MALPTGLSARARERPCGVIKNFFGNLPPQMHQLWRAGEFNSFDFRKTVEHRFYALAICSQIDVLDSVCVQQPAVAGDG